MTQKTTYIVTADEEGMRLDRWFKHHLPDVSQGLLQKWLRKKDVRVNKARAEANQRLDKGAEIYVSGYKPLGDNDPAKSPKFVCRVTPSKLLDLRRTVLYEDDHLIVFNKSAGLATQGGTKTSQHMDGYINAMFEGMATKPRLVHRLDKDTSGVLVFAKTLKAAQHMTRLFKAREVEKSYVALTVGKPEIHDGRISAPLKKSQTVRGEKILVDENDGVNAVTEFEVIDYAHNKLALLLLHPQTGRTHQLRAHCAYMKTPILGDGKYGGKAAFLENLEIPKKVFLHALSMSFKSVDGKNVKLKAPLPSHFKKALNTLGMKAKVED